MSRKAEIQSEESALNSPLRRSNRRTAVTNSPAPATLSSRRTSQSQTEAIETKTPKTRRGSTSQENLEKNEVTESKAAPRGRRASTTKEETEVKTEPAKTRSRRSSAATEPAAEETEKKQFITRLRKSIAAEEQAEPENPKSIRSRKGSAVDTPVEEDSAKKPIRTRKNSGKEETKEELPKKVLRSRRSSAADENPEIETKQKKPPTRGRRSSTDKLDEEPDAKIAKLTPSKSKRRPSVTENTANLEPIEEQESETISRKSTSPLKSELKEAIVSLTDINKQAKANLDLSTIDESSFTEESLNKSTSETKVVTPRKSPRLNKEKKVDNSNDSLTPSKSSTTEKESVDKEYSSGKSEVSKENKDTLRGSPKEIEETESPKIRAKQNKMDLKNEDIGVIESEEHNKNKSVNESLEKALSSPRKKLQFESESTEELVEIKEVIKKDEENVQTENSIHDKSDSNTESIHQSVLEAECEREKEHNKQEEVEPNKTVNPDATLDSDESFKCHLYVSNSENPNDNVEDNLNTSKDSNSSDKENIEIDSTKDLNESNLNASVTQKKIESLIESGDHNVPKEVKSIVVRVSNVFRPTMKENSFMEPMEVDESFLDITQNKKSLDLEESVVKNVPPAVSTPIVKKGIEEKEDHDKSNGDVEETDKNGPQQSIEVNKIDKLNEESTDEVKVMIVDSELTLEESEAISISKEECVEESQTQGTLSGDTINVCNLEAIRDTKISSIETIENNKSEQSTTESATNLTNVGKEERVEICESPLSEEGREHSDEPEGEPSFENIKEVETEDSRQLRSPQFQQADVELDSERRQQSTIDKLVSLEKEYCIIKTHLVELQTKPILMEPESPQPNYPSDELKQSSESTEVETKESIQLKSPQFQHADVELDSKTYQRSTTDEMLNSLEKECSKIKALIVELQTKPLLMEPETPQPNCPSDELKQSPQADVELDSKQHQRSTTEELVSSLEKEYSRIKTIVLELQTKPILMEPKSSQPNYPSDELKPQESESSLRKSMSHLRDNEYLEMKQSSERRSPRELKSPKERQTKIDQNEKNNSPKKSHRPQSQGELESDNNETPRLRSLSNKTNIPEVEIENPDVDLYEDKISPRTSKSPEHETTIEEIEVSTKKLDMPELSDFESEPDTKSLSSPVKKIDSDQESRKSEEYGKMNTSDDYEFEIPSDEEEAAEKSHVKLGEGNIKSKVQLEVPEDTGEFEISINNKGQKSPSFSPLKRKSVDSEEEQCKKIKLAQESEENVQNDSKCEVTSDELMPSEEIKNTESNIEEPTQEIVMREDNDEHAEGGLVGRDSLANSQNTPEAKVEETESDHEVLSVTEREIVKESCAVESSRNEEVPYQKEILEEHVSIKNEAETSSISAVDTDEKVNACSNLTFEISSAKIVTSEYTEDELAQNTGDVKKRNKTKNKPKEVKKLSVSTQIDANMENDNVKAIHTSKEHIMESDIQDSTQGSSVVKERKKGKKKSKKQISDLKQNKHIMGKAEESPLDKSTADAISAQLKSSHKELKVLKALSKDLKESNYDGRVEKVNTVEKSNKSKKISVVDKNKSLDLDQKKVTKRSSLGASSEEAVSSNAKKEKKHKKKKKPDVTVSESEVDRENQRKSQKETKDMDLDQVNDPVMTAERIDESVRLTLIEHTLANKTRKKHKKQKEQENGEDKENRKRKPQKKSKEDPDSEENNENQKRKSEKKTKHVDQDQLDNRIKAMERFNESLQLELNERILKDKMEKKHKKQKKPENEEDKENRKTKSQKKTKAVDPGQVGSPIKLASKDLDAKLNESGTLSRRKNEDESYSAGSTDEEDDSMEENDYICTMAEEGEEDTPSDDSNDIIDEGESINYTDSEIDSEDDYDWSDPFICDDEEEELLSGEEYDLGNEKRGKKKEKKSRIIQLDDCDDEVIKIKRKEKPIQKRKTRIISVSDSSDSELDNTDSVVRSLNESKTGINEGTTFEKEEINDDVIILEEQSTPVSLSIYQTTSDLKGLDTSSLEGSTRKKRKSIVIHENINVADIKNTEFSEKIATMVDHFCDTIYDGEVSLNFSLEHAIDTTVERDRHLKRNLNGSYYSEESDNEDNSRKQRKLNANLDDIEHSDFLESDNKKRSRKPRKLSISLDDIADADKLNQSTSKKRRSTSLGNLNTSKSKKKKGNRAIYENKDMEKAAHSKKKMKSQKWKHGSKPPTNTPVDLRTKTFSIMNQLITDVKNRPVRTIKPSTTVINANGSWISEVADVQPSTSLANRAETIEYRARKIHPKDFRNNMLRDPSRVKRIDTKTLLRKRGTYF